MSFSSVLFTMYVEGETYQFFFVWVALGHFIQYLWITTYYVRADRRWKGYGRVSAWERGLEESPDDLGLVRYLGEGFLLSNRPRKALPYLERAIRMLPDGEWAKRALDEVHVRLGSSISESE